MHRNHLGEGRGWEGMQQQFGCEDVVVMGIGHKNLQHMTGSACTSHTLHTHTEDLRMSGTHVMRHVPNSVDKESQVQCTRLSQPCKYRLSQPCMTPYKHVQPVSNF